MPNQIKRINNSRSLPLRVATGGMLGTLAVGGVVAVMSHKDVTIDVNGENISLATFSGDVEGALQDAGVVVADKDLVYPAPGESLHSGDAITVRTAKPVAVTIDGVKQEITSTELTINDLVQSLGNIAPGASVQAAGVGQAPAGSSEKITAAEASKLATKLTKGMELDIVSPKIVQIIDGGQVTFTQIAAKTVGDVLKERGITVDADDRLTPPRDTPVSTGMTIIVQHVTVAEERAVEDFRAAPQFVDDAQLVKGKEEVRVPGQPGQRAVTGRVVTVDGQVESAEVISSQELRPATPDTIARGTKPAAPAVANGSVWDSIAQCESTGNWSINTGNGFSGGLQFTPSTWLSFGGGQYAPQAWMATREQQIDVAQRVQASQGWGAWPACTAKLGIR